MDRNTNQKKEGRQQQNEEEEEEEAAEEERKAAHDRQTWRPLCICILNIYDTLSSEQSYRVRSA